MKHRESKGYRSPIEKGWEFTELRQERSVDHLITSQELYWVLFAQINHPRRRWQSEAVTVMCENVQTPVMVSYNIVDERDGEPAIYHLRSFLVEGALAVVTDQIELNQTGTALVTKSAPKTAIVSLRNHIESADVYSIDTV